MFLQKKLINLYDTDYQKIIFLPFTTKKAPFHMEGA